MEFIPLSTAPARGIGFELEPEQLLALEQIRNGWTESVRESRINGMPISEMVETFHVRHARLIEKAQERNRTRCQRRAAQ